MQRLKPSPPTRPGLFIKWLALLILPVALIGCSDSDHFGPVPTPTAVQSTPTVARAATPSPTPPTASARLACQKLAGCGQCFSDQTGQCISTDACAQRLGDDVTICINHIDGCSGDMLGDCVFPGCQGTDAGGECQ